MQTCSKCHTQSPDTVSHCPACQADLHELSVSVVALHKFRNNRRVKNIRLVVAHNCCPACREVEGTYDKMSAPSLPVEGCSHPNGCRCFYEPMLTEIYP